MNIENLVLFNVPVDNVGNIKLKDIAKVEMVDNSMICMQR